jgi:hypothetical protein
LWVNIKNSKVYVAGTIYFIFLYLLTPIIWPTSFGSDRGIFESVVYRLLDEDILYVEVWDNKEPLFYFINAIALSLTPTGDLILEIILFLSISLIAFQYQKKIISIFWFNFTISFLLLPLILIQFKYLPGYTHLPGIALFLAIIFFITRGQNRISGILLGALPFTKIIFLPSAILVILYLRYKNLINLSNMSKFFSASIAFFLIILAMRGELIPWKDILVSNYFYAIGTGSLSDNFWNLFDIEVIAYLSIVVLIVIFLNLNREEKVLDMDIIIINSLLFSSTLVLVFTGKWNHHWQILGPLILLTTILGFKSIYGHRAMFSLLLGGGLLYFMFASQIFSVKENFNNLRLYYENDKSYSAEASALLMNAKSGTYARLGQNDDNAHAKGLSSWDLVCPRFHQYPFENLDNLKLTSQCIGKAQYLILSPTFKEDPENITWNNFVSLTKYEIALKFKCTRYSKVEICENSKLKEGIVD